MKTLNNYITEKLKITKNTKVITYKYFPKDQYELRKILEERLKKDKDADLNDIDVSGIDNMYNIFEYLDPHNIDISEWNVSNVRNMSNMFYGCANFNSNLSNWDISNVENMTCMFAYCYNFIGTGLENWKPIKCKDMSHMFSGCEKINCNLSNWHVSHVKDMKEMFYRCITLHKNKLIPSWYTGYIV